MAERLTIMAVHAHPDDETFSTGGTLAKYADEGAHTVPITCTRGEEGEIVDPSMNVEEVKSRLGQVREQELRCAARALGIETHAYLDYRDSGMAGTESNQHPASFHMADLDEATGRLVRLVRRYRPQVLISYDENGTYGHPDHIKANQITVRAFETAGDSHAYPDAGTALQPTKLYYCGLSRGQFARIRRLAEEAGIESGWLRRRADDGTPRGLPQERITTTVDVTPYLGRKRAAFRCHRSQIRADSFLLTAPADFLRRAMYDEEFIRARSLVDAPTPEDDLLAGIR